MRALSALLLLGAVAVASAAGKPHILFIVIDDLGHDDMGFLSEVPQVKTPVSDRFASEGKILDNYYVQPSCSPTRSAILSGRIPLHTGINNYIPVGWPFGLSPNETTMADMLGKAGYATHAIGKWHLGMYSYAMTPTFRGFDSFYGFYNGGEDYFVHTAGGGTNLGYDMRRDTGRRCGRGCSVVDYAANNTYSTTLFTQEAVNVVENHPFGQPLFLYLAYQAVHSPTQAPESYVAPYTAQGLKFPRSTYAGMIACLDEGIGNVTSALEARGMLENTLLIFTADNGGPSETCGVQGSSNYPLRGSKCSLWEGGTKASAFAWTGKALSAQIVPGRFPDLMHAADWMATISEATGVTCDTCLKWDGFSQWKQITDQSSDLARLDVYYGITDAQVGVHGPALRKGCYKLILGDGGKPGGWVPPPNATHPLEAERVLGGMMGPLGEAVTYPPNPNNTLLLFDLCSDPNEHDPLPLDDPGYKRMSEDLQALIAGYWATETPACPDPGCEGWGGDSKCSYGTPVNISGIPTWEPWCD
eukprot:TRINITY_DN57808_c0_g1_i1.p1 TRINITY_DN57808_c0_g1~~TRINITY_DN57808_c0_g1_i1.p1  ORF type:complete len:530 (+),score=186.62 TRINITY_DN57808_c0_g1_i1:57-1646(+)